MAALGRVIVEAIVHHYGRDELLRRLAHPFWFQSFGAVMGMDWHSSGITTSVIGALKRGLAPLENELGVSVCGGRGRPSRRTPSALASAGARARHSCRPPSHPARAGGGRGLAGDALAQTSRLVAKIASGAVQDGYEPSLHAFIVSAAGNWCIVQKGIHDARREARRYHWL